MRINYLSDDFFHFYVEDYERSAQTLWLDFVSEEEFSDFTEIFELNVPDRETKQLNYLPPSNILVLNCKLTKIHDGGMLCISKTFLRKQCNELFNIKNRYTDNENSAEENWPVSVLFKFTIKDNFAAEILSNAFISLQYPPKAFIKDVSSFNITSMPVEQCRLPHDKPSDIVVWDVDQGSTNVVTLKNNQTSEENKIFFDCGCNMHFKQEKIENILLSHGFSKISSKSEKNIFLIISHWDKDHYNLLYDNNNMLLNRVNYVIIPSHYISKTVGNAIALLKSRLGNNITAVTPPNFLPNRKRVCSRGNIGGNSYIELFTGKYAKSINNSGLMLTVKGQDKTVFLTGDHDNKQVWDEQYSFLNGSTKTLSLVVPHHGGNSHTKLVITNPKNLKLEDAVFSYGKGNSYGHPVPKVLQTYINTFTKVYETAKNGDITIAL